MAEKKTYEVNLYDANGAYVGTAEHDEDMLDPAMRTKVLESGGKQYTWDQRNGRWIETGGVVKIHKPETPKPEASVVALEKK